MNAIARVSFSTPLSVVFLLAACASSPHLAPPPGSAYQAPEYLIGADDVLAVRVWKNSELDVAGPVRSDGKITMPLIGDVDASGRTPQAVAESIETALSAFVHDAKVAVQVTEMRSNEYMSRVRVTGAVRTPMSLPWREGMTVLDAVLAAGGPTDFAAADRTALHRRNHQATSSHSVALGTILEDGDLVSNYPVHPGDVITVPQRGF